MNIGTLRYTLLYLLDGGEAEVGVEGSQLGVGGGLLELAVTLAGVEHDVSSEAHGIYSQRNIFS